MKRGIALMIVVLLGLGACGPLPRPFGRDTGEKANPLAQNIFFDGVEVEPLTGTTRPMGRLLAESVAKRLERDYELPSAIEGLDKSRFVLTGHVQINDRDPTARTFATIDWQLDERETGPIDAFVQDIPATRFEWDYGAANIIDKIGVATSAHVAKLVLGDRFGTAGQDRLLGRRGVYVTDAQGAPGDGPGALRRAMSVSLGGYGLRIANGPDEAAFSVGAEVDVGPPEDGAQAVRIVWTVKDVNGKILGRAKQANAVPEGALDGNWGRTAAFAAAAATDGVIKIIARNDPSKLRAPNLGGGQPSSPYPPAPPPPSGLERVPGRAPPPPS